MKKLIEILDSALMPNGFKRWGERIINEKNYKGEDAEFIKSFAKSIERYKIAIYVMLPLLYFVGR